jgi:hypothetical protein
VNGHRHWSGQKLEAPTDNQTALVSPSGARLRSMAVANQTCFDNDVLIGGQSLREIRSLAKRQLSQAATEYTRLYVGTEVPEPLMVGPDGDLSHLVLSGHQPILFHPGIWFKNFLLHELAGSTGLAINLLIDNDLCEQTAIRVPVVTSGKASQQLVQFDRASEPIPFESRAIIDDAYFQSFPDRLKQVWVHGQDNLLVDRFWRHLGRDSDSNLGQRLAKFRHLTEWEAGLRTLELPLSQACRFEAFESLVTEFMMRGKEFRNCHNRLLQDYRNYYGIRSSSHPVPALAAEGDSWELPFWIGTERDPQRRRLFQKRVSGGWLIHDLGDVTFRLPETPEQGWLQSAEKEGVRIRPRALVTTLFARLMLCDVFIHGTGGARYDEFNDALIREFFRIDAPQFVTATATIRLPQMAIRDDADQQLETARQRLRDLNQHPERFVQELPAEASEQGLALAKEKLRTVQERQSFSSPKAFQDHLKSIRQQLEVLMEPLIAETNQELQSLEALAANAQVLNARDYSCVCYPEELISQMNRLARDAVTA